MNDPMSLTQQVCALLGQPVAGNATQFMMDKAFAYHGLDWRYLTLEVAPQALGDAVRGMRAMGFFGGNVTKPHKVAVVPLLDRLSEEAARVGAVNCIVREGNELVGENNDGRGFLAATRKVIDPAGRRAVILGSGGAARSIAIELAAAGAAELTVVVRGADRGQQMREIVERHCALPVRVEPWEGDYIVPEPTDLLVHATSTGLNDARATVPLKLDRTRTEMVVAEVIASPPETRLLLEAKRRGHPTVDGLSMIVYQSVMSFERWTGVKTDPSIFREAAEEFLES